MRRLVAVLALLTVACEPPCLKGHYVTRHVPFACETDWIEIGDITVPIDSCTPAHDVQDFVCDQYQLEK